MLLCQHHTRQLLSFADLMTFLYVDLYCALEGVFKGLLLKSMLEK